MDLKELKQKANKVSELSKKQKQKINDPSQLQKFDVMCILHPSEVDTLEFILCNALENMPMSNERKRDVVNMLNHIMSEEPSE